jgi:Spy/CpxP family protein refolding chaperone
MRVSRFLAAALFVVAAVIVVEAQQPGGFRFGSQSLYVTVLNNKALQEELKVTATQKEKFKAIAEKNAEENKKRFEEYGPKFKDAAGDMDKLKEIGTSMQKESQKANEEVRKKVEELLSDDQKKRISQIERQQGGVRAFLKEENAKALSLTDDQKGKIKGIVDEYQKDVQDVMKSSGGSFKDGKFSFDKDKFAESQKKRDKLTKAAMGDIDDLLTADQRKTWKEMIGDPFDLSKLTPQFGGFPQPKNKTKD